MSRPATLHWVGNDSFPGGARLPVIEHEFESSIEAPGRVRAFLRSTFAEWAIDGMAEQAALLTTELATNAVVHVGESFVVRARRLRTGVRVEVEDSSASLPELQHPHPEETHGRGILLVDALASRWGTERHEHGKTVWFELEAGGS